MFNGSFFYESTPNIFSIQSFAMLGESIKLYCKGVVRKTGTEIFTNLRWKEPYLFHLKSFLPKQKPQGTKHENVAKKSYLDMTYSRGRVVLVQKALCLFSN